MHVSGPSGVSKLWVNPDFRSEGLEEALRTGPQALVERFGAQSVRSAASARLWRLTLTCNGWQTGVYLKKYLYRSVWDRLKHLVRHNRAVRALKAAQLLHRHGFHAPDVIAIGSWGENASACFMATREVTSTVSVLNYVAPDPGDPALCPLRERRKLFRQLGLTIGCMHRPLRLRSHLRLKNLVQINMVRGVSNSDRLRFFRSYLLMNPRVRRHDRRWAGRIMTRTRRRFALARLA